MYYRKIGFKSLGDGLSSFLLGIHAKITLFPDQLKEFTKEVKPSNQHELLQNINNHISPPLDLSLHSWIENKRIEDENSFLKSNCGMELPLQRGSLDKVVQSTNDDAATSKLKAVKLGYYVDEALDLILSGISLPERAPIMLRGYHIRAYIMRDITRKFLQEEMKGSEKKRQIVNLGAGFDTIYFWLRKNGLSSENTHYFELDFLPVLQKKLQAISKQPNLLSQLQDPSIDIRAGTLDSKEYSIIPTDLRDIQGLTSALEQRNFDPKIPTLFLSECVLIYMKPEHSQAIVKWIKEKVSLAVFACYEQIKPNSPFGKMMIQNLERRGCALLGITAFPDEEAQRKRFLDLGWDRAEAYNMNQLYERYIPLAERRRVERIQMLDEIEEWMLINEHYCISWAICDPLHEAGELFFLN